MNSIQVLYNSGVAVVPLFIGGLYLKIYRERGIYLEERTKALLVGVNLNNDPEFETALKELESLAEACNMEVIGVETQNVSQINTGVYVGTGRVEEIKAVAHMLGAEVIIFDNTLSPMQLRNLKDIIERPVFDRTHLILQIFSSRARTREAQIQVETARKSDCPEESSIFCVVNLTGFITLFLKSET